MPVFIISDKYTTQDVRFEWREVAPWLGIGPVGSEQRSQFRLPKYVVTFVTDKSNHIRNFGEGKCIFIALRLCLRLVTNYVPINANVLLLYAGMSPALLGADDRDRDGSVFNKYYKLQKKQPSNKNMYIPTSVPCNILVSVTVCDARFQF